MEPGTGKTITSLALVAQKQKKLNRCLFVLTVCPKNIIGSWEDEINTHLEEGSYLFIDNLKDYLYIDFDLIKTIYKAVFLVINYEQARILIHELCKMDIDFIILDESHRIKNRKAKTTQALLKLSHIVYRVILSGTPITKDEIDLWSQLLFLNPFIWGSNWYSFATKALKKIKFKEYFILKPDKKKMSPFMERASKFTYQIKLDDIAELPGCNHSKVRLTMKGSAKRAYQELENGFLTEYEGKRSSHALSVTGMIRLQQLTGGHLTLETNDVVRMKEQPKLAWILDKLEDIGDEKLFIVCRYTLEIELIAAALKKYKYKYVIMKGGMKPEEISKARREFQNNKKCQVLIGQIASVKEGNNFQKLCRYGVFYSKSLSFVDIKQCIARLYRNGQSRKVMWWHLIMKGTIDESVEVIIDKKYLNAEEALFKLVMKRKRTMAKETTTKKAVAKKPAAKATTKPAVKKAGPNIERPKFGIDAVAKAMGIDARAVRIKLRNNEIAKKGQFYDFKDSDGVAKMAAKLAPAAKAKPSAKVTTKAAPVKKSAAPAKKVAVVKKSAVKE